MISNGDDANTLIIFGFDYCDNMLASVALLETIPSLQTLFVSTGIGGTNSGIKGDYLLCTKDKDNDGGSRNAENSRVVYYLSNF